ncbi:cupin domain-containing protein [Albimonas sp. CAU 1670]|uniref:(R)-mandelonitrile lyase n=1 Tax=Albimonas sp. CAU 1670 TaxID=3032599 RepID=UPI0023DAE7FC|nr:cupin domain-containing protein [Albimonas sp. CAU 1670]MDF2232017.1 cupin domain-containing protein [Albimonas sp. CAU 1670]
MELFPAGRPAARANPDYFTGEVWQEPINSAPAPARVAAIRVTFLPGARTNWHTHPFGQTLFVVSGFGRVGTRGGPVRIIRPGDAIWFAPGEEHWHGAAPDSPMAHIAMQEKDDGRTADWLEPVADADYLRTPE